MSVALRPILIVPDLHAPYHNKRALRLVLNVGRWLKPEHLVVMGDLLDCYSISDHDKSPDRANRMEWEIEEGNKVIDELDALGARSKDFVEGNHCDRIRRYLMKHPELHGIVSVVKLLRLKERGWRYTPYKRHTKVGKVHFTHDVGVSSRQAIFKALDLYQHSVVTGHTHRMQYIVENNALGTSPKVSASFGWLGDCDKIDYMTQARARHDWSLGFGIGHLRRDTGYIHLTPVPILPDYSCVVSGKLFMA